MVGIGNDKVRSFASKSYNGKQESQRGAMVVDGA